MEGTLTRRPSRTDTHAHPPRPGPHSDSQAEMLGKAGFAKGQCLEGRRNRQAYRCGWISHTEIEGLPGPTEALAMHGYGLALWLCDTGHVYCSQ